MSLHGSRRDFLETGAALVAGGSILAALAACSRDGGPPLESERARSIGARYADAYPEGAEGLWRGRPPRSADEWAPRIEALRREDFEADRVVRVDGWWMAETELRLCVLLHATG